VVALSGISANKSLLYHFCHCFCFRFSLRTYVHQILIEYFAQAFGLVCTEAKAKNLLTVYITGLNFIMIVHRIYQYCVIVLTDRITVSSIRLSCVRDPNFNAIKSPAVAGVGPTVLFVTYRKGHPRSTVFILFERVYITSY